MVAKTTPGSSGSAANAAAGAYDVAVLGLGAMGSAAALHLSRRGLKVLGLDRFRPPHDRGSHHGGSRVIRQAYFEHPDYVPLALRAYELWEALQRDSGQDLMRITGALMVGRPETEVVAGALSAAEKHGLAHEVLEGAELSRRFPPFRPADGATVGVFEAAGGLVYPEKVIEASLRLASLAGADLRFEEPAESWESDGEGIRVTTGRGVYAARRVVLAAGAWMTPASQRYRPPIRVTRQAVAWMAPREELRHFLPENFPAWVWQLEGENVFYGLPALDDVPGSVKVGMHTLGPETDADSEARAFAAADEQAFRDFFGRHMHALDGPVMKGSICLYSNTPDGHFLLGAHPDHPQVLVVGGFSGHGFKFAPLIGEIAADLVTTGATRHPIGLFALDRFADA